MRRVNEALRQVLADGIEELADPGLGFVTVTAVRASSDLSQATVYVSVLGGDRSAARRHCGRSSGPTACSSDGSREELHFKRTPLLTFRL